MGKFHLLCGKIASGKSTLAAALAAEGGCVCISEDAWLSTLYPNEIDTLKMFARRSKNLEDAIGPHLTALLSAGLDVVLDFHANTRTRRRWMRDIINRSGCDHELHFLDVPDDVCKQRLRARNVSGDHTYQASDAEFDQFARYFEPPADEEGFNVTIHGDQDT